MWKRGIKAGGERERTLHWVWEPLWMNPFPNPQKELVQRNGRFPHRKTPFIHSYPHVTHRKLGVTLASGWSYLVFGLLLDSVGELGDLVIDRPALSHQLADLSIGMHHSRVIAAAKTLPTLWKAEFCQLAAQVHRDLAGIHQNPAPVTATEIFNRETEIGRGLSHDCSGGDLWPNLIWDQILKNNLS